MQEHVHQRCDNQPDKPHRQIATDGRKVGFGDVSIERHTCKGSCRDVEHGLDGLGGKCQEDDREGESRQDGIDIEEDGGRKCGDVHDSCGDEPYQA